MNYIKSHKLQLFLLILFTIFISELLVFLQLKIFWSDYNYNIGYWLGFWTPLIDGLVIMAVLIYLNNKNNKLLKSQKDRLQEIIDSSIDGIHIIDKNGNLFMFSPSFAKMLGYTFEETKKLNIKDWDLSFNDEFLKKVFEESTGNQKLIYTQHTKKDSSRIEVEIFVKYIEIDGQKYIYATSRDVSKQLKLEKEIEAKNKKLQVSEEVLRDYVLFSKTDEKGIITDVSNAFCHLTGYEKKELLGKSHSILRHEDMSNSTYDQLWKTIKDDKVWVGELKNKKKNGEVYWVKATIKPEFDEEENFIGYISIREDITDKKKFEQEHLLLLDQAKMASMAEMIENIAHQWRQPLSAITTISSGINLNYEMGIENNRKELIENNELILKNANYLSNTIEVFKNFIQDSKLQTTISLQEEISDAIAIIEAGFKNNHIEISLNMCENRLEKFITKHELSQVIINILNNSKDAFLVNKIKNRQVRINLKTEGNNAIITICDNAGGIEEQILSKVFDPYFTTKHSSQGKGLGLHLSYQIITESLKGVISAKNSEEGVCIQISIPFE